MATKLKEFVTKLAKKAGFDTASDGAKAFLESLNDVEVPEDVEKGIDNSLISLTEAKNNHGELKSHYTKQALDGIDKELLSLIDDFQVDETNKNEILAERSSYKRVPLVARRIVELERKKIATTGGKDKQEIQKQIDELQGQLKSAKEQLEIEKTNFANQRLQDKINMKKNVLYSGMKTVHDELDPETRNTILDSQITKALQDNGVKLAFDDQGNFTLLRNDGTNYFGENHQQVKPQQFIEQVLAKNKQLKVSDSSNGANGTKPQPGAQPTASSGSGAKDSQSQSALIARNNQALADFQAAEKNGTFGMSA